MGKHAFWMASFQCLAKSLERGTQQSYIREALLPNIQLPCHWQQNTKNQSHKLPENTNALLSNDNYMYRYMYATLFCDIVFHTYLVYFEI